MSLRQLSIVVSGEGGGINYKLGDAKILAPLSLSSRQSSIVASGEGGMEGAPKSYKRLWRPLSLSLRQLSILQRQGRGALRGAQILHKIMAPPLSVIKIVGKNVLLIYNIFVYCLSLFPSVLFEKLTATVVFYFTRCHLKTFDNCHVITIHIQYTSFGITFNVDSI